MIFPIGKIGADPLCRQARRGDRATARWVVSLFAPSQATPPTYLTLLSHPVAKKGGGTTRKSGGWSEVPLGI